MAKKMKICYIPVAKQIKVGEKFFQLSDLEMNFIDRWLVGDRLSLGRIVEEMRATFPEFYFVPEDIGEKVIRKTIEATLALAQNKGLIKTIPEGADFVGVSSYPEVHSGRKVLPEEVVICFDWLFDKASGDDLSLVAKLTGLNVYYKLPANVQQSIRKLFQTGNADSGRYVVTRPESAQKEGENHAS